MAAQRISAALILVASLAAATLAHADDAPNYTIHFDAKTQSLSVRVCLVQAHARVVFDTDSKWAMQFVHDLRRDSGQPVTSGDGAWSAAVWKPDECIAYRADLAAIVATHQRDVGWRQGDDLVTAPQLWLLRPDVQGNAAARATVSMPAGWSISVPWLETTSQARATVGKRELSSGHSVEKLVPSSKTAKIKKRPSLGAAERLVPSSMTAKIKKQASVPALLDKARFFTIPNTPPDWSATVAFGRFSEERIALPGGVLRLSILHGADAQQQEKLHTWLAQVSRAILSAYGRLPVADVQVLMFPVSGHSRAVVFGQHTRGEGNSLQLLIDPTRPSSEFMHDWVAVHELSHLMHPYLGDSGSWVAEGLATYFQNVLRARAGLLTPQQAWDEFDDGFKRGQSTTTEGTLTEAARNMHRSHAYQRIYWAGAAYWLSVDRDLRRESNGELDIDIALSRFRDCCLPAYHGWKPKDFVAKLDSLLGVHTFSQHYREFAAMNVFPQWQKIYSDLGIRDDDGHVRLENTAAEAKVRDAIMASRPPIQ